MDFLMGTDCRISYLTSTKATADAILTLRSPVIDTFLLQITFFMNPQRKKSSDNTSEDQGGQGIGSLNPSFCEKCI